MAESQLYNQGNQMTNHLLLNLLRAGLLSDLGEDDQRLKHAGEAAQNMAEWLAGEGRSKLAAALLRAIDESTAPVDDPVLNYAYNCLLDKWPSARNAFPETPTELLRAITFQAAVTAAADDEDLETANWYVLRTIRALGVSVGRWEEVVRDEISRIDAVVSERLDLVWLPSTDIDELRMPPVVTSDSLDDSELKTFAQKLGGALRAQLKARWAVVEASLLRESLLWWHLAAYSDVLGERYADVSDPALCAIATALDIRRLTPLTAPTAVEHLLDEAIASSIGTELSITFKDLATAWERIGPKREVSVDGYGLVVSAIAANDPDMSILTLPETLTPGDAAKSVFRDLQVIGLLSACAVDLPEPES